MAYTDLIEIETPYSGTGIGGFNLFTFFGWGRSQPLIGKHGSNRLNLLKNQSKGDTLHCLWVYTKATR